MRSDPLNLVVIGIGGVGRRLALQTLSELPWVKTGFVESLSSRDSERDVDGPQVPFTIAAGDLNFAELQSDGFEPLISQISFFPMDRFSFRHLAGLSPSSAINLLRNRLLKLQPRLGFSSWLPSDYHPITTLNHDWLTPALSRAAFLAFQDDLMRDLLPSQFSPVSRVKIVASPGGKLGAACVGDVADFVSRRWPSSKIDVILVDCSSFLRGQFPDGTPYLRYALRSLIAIEEISALVQSRNNLGKSSFSLNLLSDLTTDPQGSCPGLDVLIPPLKTLLQYNESRTNDVTRVLLSSHLEKRVQELSQSTYPMDTSREQLIKTWGLRTR